jgi:hypothetical protein
MISTLPRKCGVETIIVKHTAISRPFSFTPVAEGFIWGLFVIIVIAFIGGLWLSGAASNPCLVVSLPSLVSLRLFPSVSQHISEELGPFNADETSNGQ